MVRHLLIFAFLILAPVVASARPHFNGNVPKHVQDKCENLLELVCDITGYSSARFQVRVQILNNEQEYSKLLPGAKIFPAVYVRETNTILVFKDKVEDGILIHEITHALLEQESLHTLTTTCQEVIAGYVEYQFKKKAAVTCTCSAVPVIKENVPVTAPKEH
jgi:hypothetical protein